MLQCLCYDGVARMITIPVNNFRAVELWCTRIIGPRSYWLHNKVGGRGWELKLEQGRWNLRLEDDKQATMAILKFSDQ